MRRWKQSSESLPLNSSEGWSGSWRNKKMGKDWTAVRREASLMSVQSAFSARNSNNQGGGGGVQLSDMLRALIHGLEMNLGSRLERIEQLLLHAQNNQCAQSSPLAKGLCGMAAGFFGGDVPSAATAAAGLVKSVPSTPEQFAGPKLTSNRAPGAGAASRLSRISVEAMREDSVIMEDVDNFSNANSGAGSSGGPHPSLFMIGPKPSIYNSSRPISPDNLTVSVHPSTLPSHEVSFKPVDSRHQRASARRRTNSLASWQPSDPLPLHLRAEWKTNVHEPMEAVSVGRSEKERDTQEFNKTPDVMKPWYIILPSSRFHLFWVLTTVSLIAYDMATVPVTLAFDTGDNQLTTFLFWPFLLFWTLDMPVSFLTGFYRDGNTQVRLWPIAVSYLRSWFLVDSFLLSTGWWEVWMREEREYFMGQAGRGLRALRVLRSMRVLRLAKVHGILKEFENHITSDYKRIMLQVCKLILTIIWMNHFIACAWWGIGVNTAGWTTFYEYEDRSLPMKYFTSLHWSLTQFTPASMDVSAHNLPERVYSVIVLLFAMVTFSSFVSSLTAASTQLRQLTDNRDMNFSTLRRYLRSHEVPTDLAIRILQCVEHRLSKQKSEINENQVQFLGLLSTPLQLELALHIFAPSLLQHPFFHRYSAVDSKAMERICAEAVTQHSYYTKDVLFTEGNSCEQMFFVLSGQLFYSSRRDLLSFETAQGSPNIASFIWGEDGISEGEWCCEVCLWYPWVHRGTMTAGTVTDVQALSVPAFTSITTSFPLIYRLSVCYAALLTDCLQQRAMEGEVLSDISFPSADYLEGLVERAYYKRWSAIAKASPAKCGSSVGSAPRESVGSQGRLSFALPLAGVTEQPSSSLGHRPAPCKQIDASLHEGPPSSSCSSSIEEEEGEEVVRSRLSSA